MSESAPCVGETLRALVGKRITGMRRLVYVLREEQIEEGGLEMTLECGVLFFDAGSDGETLRICKGPWVDPFAPPLSPENSRYVEESGAWRAFVLKDRRPFSGLIGSVVQSATAIAGDEGQVIGTMIELDCGRIRIEVEGDELRVDAVDLRGS